MSVRGNLRWVIAQVVVPEHQELAEGTLRAIIRDVDLSVEELRVVTLEQWCGLTATSCYCPTTHPESDKEIQLN